MNIAAISFRPSRASSRVAESKMISMIWRAQGDIFRKQNTLNANDIKQWGDLFVFFHVIELNEI